MADEPQARVVLIDGEPVLIDPAAVAVARAVAKYNCRAVYDAQLERAVYFAKRMAEMRRDPKDVVIVLINVDSGPVAKELADALMPGHDWQQYRNRGETPFARGLAARQGIQELLDTIDKEAAEKLRVADVATVVFDYGVAEVF